MHIVLKKPATVVAVLVTAATVAFWAAATSAQNRVAGPFNATQVEGGRAAYVVNCQSCHTDNLSGSGEAVPLAGRAFLAGFGDKTTKELFDTIKTEMPLGAPGRLSDEAYTDIVAFMLHASGAATGTTALTPATA